MGVVKKGKKFYVVIEVGKDPETKRRTQKWLSGYDTEKEAKNKWSENISCFRCSG